MEKICKYCAITLTVDNKCGKRLCCKPCRSKKVISDEKKNPQKRRDRINAWKIKTGKVKKHPCEKCGEWCYRKYAKAFCSDICRFMSYVEISDECWLWKGALNRGGYGKVCFRGNKTTTSHRASYIIHKGPIEDDMFVCHICDVRNCVNPAHLFLGTHNENMMDMIEKGRQNSKLTPLQVIDIRESVVNKGVSQATICEQFNITTGTVSSIIHNRIWKHV